MQAMEKKIFGQETSAPLNETIQFIQTNQFVDTVSN